jgi:hypothetical protein
MKWGYYVGKGGADGIFGALTYNAVVSFQKAMGLSVDGMIGSRTLAKLESDPIPILHFSENEFRCHHCGKLPKSGIDPALFILLERIRSAAGDKLITITSGYRCPTWNRKNGGALLSQHLYGRAADIIIEGMGRADTDALCDRMNPYGGVGMGGEHITHVDVRGKRARWRYGKGDA